MIHSVLTEPIAYWALRVRIAGKRLAAPGLMADNTGRSTVLVIAFVASAIVCLQNVMSLTGFTWALIHGAGVESALAFAPAAIALALIWGGYFLITRNIASRATLLFAALAIGVVVLNELVIPVTPLQMWRNNLALNGVRVLAVRDEPLLSAHGNPIGVRISFDAVVPRTTAYSIYGAAYNLTPDTMWPLGFGYFGDRRVDPNPTAQPGSGLHIFQKGIVYTISQDMVPVFLRYDEKTKKPCLAEVRTKYISETDFLTALAANRDVPLKVAVSVNGEYNAVTVWVAERVTSHHYDMQAMYDTIAKEGGGRCEPSAPTVTFGSSTSPSVSSSPRESAGSLAAYRTLTRFMGKPETGTRSNVIVMLSLNVPSGVS